MSLNRTITTVLFSISFLYAISHINTVAAQTASNDTAPVGPGAASNDTAPVGPGAASFSVPAEAAPLSDEIALNGSTSISLSLQNPQPPRGTVWNYVIDSLPLYGSIQPINKKGDPIPNGMLTYRASNNFSGVDSFTYKITDNTSSSKSGWISIKTYAANPIIKEPIPRIIVAILIAIASVVAIVLASSRIIAKLQNSVVGNPIDSSKFGDILRSNNMDPSLSVFQFFLWTIVLMFSLFSIYLIRILGGVTEAIPGPPPVMLFALTGISFATPSVSSFISSIRYPKTDDPETVRTLEGSDRDVRPPWGEMLREFGKPSLSRFQMFGWTWISIAVYLFIYGGEIMRDSNNVINLSIPDVFPILVALMGLSELVFLGAKATVTTQIEITKVFPLQVRKGRYMSIFG
jgi:hypothetical protein